MNMKLSSPTSAFRLWLTLLVCCWFVLSGVEALDDAEAGGVDRLIADDPNATAATLPPLRLSSAVNERRRKIFERSLEVVKTIRQADCPHSSPGYISNTMPQFGLCTHGHHDIVSGYFIKDGFWRDCLDLPHIAIEAFQATLKPVDLTIKAPFVVEIGGNIGACALLLASQGCDVMAFEPLQDNYKVLNASVLMNRMEDQIVLVPKGASEKEGLAKARAEKDNFGNTIVQAAPSESSDSTNNSSGLDALKMNLKAAQPIQLTRIDSLVHRHVHLMKLDCQGSELAALRGATGLLRNFGVDLMQLEFDPILLRAVGSEPIELLHFLWEYDYDLYDLREYHQKWRHRTALNISLADVVPLPEASAQAFVTYVNKTGAVDLLAVHRSLKNSIPVWRLLMKAHPLPSPNVTEFPSELWNAGMPVVPVIKAKTRSSAIRYR